VVICAQTSGVVLAFKWAEAFIHHLGIKSTLNVGFAILLIASYAFWSVISDAKSYTVELGTALFLCRLFSGIGSGLLCAACLISHVQLNYEEFGNVEE
jgi:fucose permease